MQCPSCKGKGVKKCPECKGRGRPFDCGYCTNISENKTWGTIPCGNCKGTGKITPLASKNFTPTE